MSGDAMDRPYTIGVIRVVTQDQARVDAHGRLIERWLPGVRAVSRCIPNQPEGVHDAATKRAAAPKVAALARELAAAGVDGIAVSCADDPGVAQARTALRIPVVGAGESTAAAAARFDGPVGVLGITPEAPPAFARILAGRLVGNVVPHGVRTTLDLETPESTRNALAAARDLRDRGACVIALACTGFATIGLAPELELAAGIPVLDAVQCEASALMLELMRANARCSADPMRQAGAKPLPDARR